MSVATCAEHIHETRFTVASRRADAIFMMLKFGNHAASRTSGTTKTSKPMFWSRKDNLAIAVVLPAQGPPVITIRCTRGGPSLSEDAFHVVRFCRVASSQRVRAASVAQGAACLNLRAARHMVARAGGVQLHGCSQSLN